MNNPTPRTMIPSSARFITPRNKCARLLIACSLMLVFTCGAYAKSAKWEYSVESASLNNRQLETLLNRKAAEGWELVQIGANGVAIFRRKK